MRRVLVANRGEIALRAIRACRQLGHESLAVFSSADANSPHRWAADHAICIGPPPATASYLNAAALLETAIAMKCDAVYPGYGFLAENSAFAERCCEAGLIFIGPDGECIARMGDKVAARQAAAAIGIPVVPGSEQGFASPAPAGAVADDLGFPLLLKASGGGGGRGMRVVTRAEDFAAQFEQASTEAKAAFGNAEIYLERFFPQVRHIEIQVFGDRHGNHAHLGERDCSVQRRHQKLVEESPSPALDQATRTRMAEAAVALIKSLNYVNAGTVEFIFDPASGKFFFIEMNTRIQVEHPVTEMVTGTDLVVEQFRVAAGEKLSFGSTFSEGRTAIEFRINAEDAARDFRPSPGLLTRWRPPSGRNIRIDSHVYENYAVPPYYDSMLAKLIVTGPDRAAAVEVAKSALARFQVSGLETTVPFHARLLQQPEFARAEVHTRWVEENLQAVTH
jgi:acetyl-CoA carboxylase biotin carboxylase subunit